MSSKGEQTLEGLFLGAGASYDCYLPLVWELTAALKKSLSVTKLREINAVRQRHGDPWSARALETFSSLLSDPNMHYEQVIGALETEYAATRDGKGRKELHELHSFLLQSVHIALLEWQIRYAPLSLDALGSYAGIETLVHRNRPLWIFSLNHDVIVEMLAKRLGFLLKTGFHGNEKLRISEDGRSIRELDCARLSRDSLSSRNFDFFGNGEHGVNLIKLHGALDIFAQGDEKDYLKLAPQGPDSATYLQQLRTLIEVDIGLARRDGVRAVNEHSYLDEAGDLQFLRNSLLSGGHKFDPSRDQIAPPEFLALFDDRLNLLTRIYCIGYGFADTHINQRLVRWLTQSAERSIVVINPGIEHCPHSLLECHRQVELQRVTATEFFLSMSTRPETFGERVRRIARERNRSRL